MAGNKPDGYPQPSAQARSPKDVGSLIISLGEGIQGIFVKNRQSPVRENLP